MSSIIDLPLINPVVTPAKEAVRWPQTWARMVLITTPDPLTVHVKAELQPMRILEDGTIELKPEVDGDIITIEDTVPRPVSTQESAGLVGQTIMGFMAQGGNLLELIEAGILIVTKDIGVRQGKLGQQVVVEEPPVVPVPVTDVPPVEPKVLP